MLCLRCGKECGARSGLCADCTAEINTTSTHPEHDINDDSSILDSDTRVSNDKLEDPEFLESVDDIDNINPTIPRSLLLLGFLIMLTVIIISVVLASRIRSDHQSLIPQDPTESLPSSEDPNSPLTHPDSSHVSIQTRTYTTPITTSTIPRTLPERNAKTKGYLQTSTSKVEFADAVAIYHSRYHSVEIGFFEYKVTNETLRKLASEQPFSKLREPPNFLISIHFDKNSKSASRNSITNYSISLMQHMFGSFHFNSPRNRINFNRTLTTLSKLDDINISGSLLGSNAKINIECMGEDATKRSKDTFTWNVAAKTKVIQVR